MTWELRLGGESTAFDACVEERSEDLGLSACGVVRVESDGVEERRAEFEKTGEFLRMGPRGLVRGGVEEDEVGSEDSFVDEFREEDEGEDVRYRPRLSLCIR